MRMIANRKAENQEVANEQTRNLRITASDRTAKGEGWVIGYVEVCHETQTPQAHHSSGVQSLSICIAIGLKDKG